MSARDRALPSSGHWYASSLTQASDVAWEPGSILPPPRLTGTEECARDEDEDDAAGRLAARSARDEDEDEAAVASKRARDEDEDDADPVAWRRACEEEEEEDPDPLVRSM